MRLRRKSESISCLLNGFVRGFELLLDFTDQIIVDDTLGRFPRDTFRNLGQVSATHIQAIGIKMHVAIGAVMRHHLADKFIIKFAAPPCQI